MDCTSCQCLIEDEDASFCEYCGTAILSTSPALSNGLSSEPTDINIAQIETLDQNIFDSSNDSTLPIIVKYDQGTCSEFVAGVHSAIHLAFDEKDNNSVKNLKVLVQTPTQYQEVKRVFYLPSKCSINLPANALEESINAAIELFFTCTINGEEKAFHSFFNIDIHEKSGQIKTQLNINVGDINYGSGNATDATGNINLINQDLLQSDRDKLRKRESQWSDLSLHEISLDDCPFLLTENFSSANNLQDDKQKPAQEQARPTFPTSPQAKSLSLELASGETLHIFSHDLTLGRSREADLLTRNYPSPNSSDPQTEMKTLNINMSSLHASITINDSGFAFIDGNAKGPSTNKSKVNGRYVNGSVKLDNSGTITLAPNTSSSFTLNYESFSDQALILKRSDKLKQVYLIIKDHYDLEAYLKGYLIWNTPVGLCFSQQNQYKSLESLKPLFKSSSTPAKLKK
ncbi:FHA domain-containing protein [Lentisphaera profundi]|uniref:FHA domain-containing protein n=1 Tax=Lentisphaera profundi TaxID=1658616 RepID=A0ABY7VUY7_9BACT|nr:FHA domain-containing protein [Lentisphaera profundi]WDE96641.1 FHA domain-containing protein [Lentisphaera profundi]